MNKNNGFEHQDWEPTIIKSKENNKQQYYQKQNAPGTKEFQELNGDDIPVLNKISKQQQQLLLQGRQAKGITRKQLAASINIPESIVSDYENGKVQKFNKGIYNKMIRFLGVKE